MSKFKIGDIVQTNLTYVGGFDEYCSAPKGIKRKNDLKVIGMVDTPKTEMARGGFLYTLLSKSNKEFQILECFLEVQE